jgi:hypothetical protein
VSVFVDVTAEVRAREEAAAERAHVERIAQGVDRVLFTSRSSKTALRRCGT